MVKKNYDDMLSRFHLVPERNGRTDGRTDRFAISLSRVSMLTRNKKLILLWQQHMDVNVLFFDFVHYTGLYFI